MSLPVEKFTLVYFATRSVGYGRNGDILQLAVRFGHGKTYSVWIKPSGVAAKYVSEIEGLEIRDGELFFRNAQLPTVPLAVGMYELSVFLKSSTKPVILVSHASQFASVLLLQAILQTDTVDDFNSTVVGFSDSLPIFIEKFPNRKGRGTYELAALARDLLKYEHTKEFFEASLSLEVLEKLIITCKLKNRIIQKRKSFEEALLSEMGGQYGCIMVQGLEPLRVATTMGTMKKVAEGKVSFSALKEVFDQKGSTGLRMFLSETLANGKPRVSDSPHILQQITQFFEAGTSSHSSSANQPTYSYVDPMKKLQDRINREIDVLRRKQEQGYEDVDLLRKNSMYAGTDSNEDRTNDGVELRKKQEQDYDYVDPSRPNAESMYAETYSDEDRINRGIGLRNQQDYDYVDPSRPNTESMYAETYSDEDRINRGIGLRKEQDYDYVDPLRPNTESMYAETYSDEDRINRGIGLRKEQDYEYVDPSRPNTESMYAETYSDEFNVPSYSHIDPLKKQQDRINRGNDSQRKEQEPIYENVDLLKEKPESPYAEIDSKEDNASGYSYIDRLKKQQDRINRELDGLRQKQEQTYANVDLLRTNLKSNYEAVRPEEGEEKQVDDDTVQLRQKRLSGNDEDVLAKRRAIYMQTKRK